MAELEELVHKVALVRAFGNYHPITALRERVLTVLEAVEEQGLAMSTVPFLVLLVAEKVETTAHLTLELQELPIQVVVVAVAPLTVLAVLVVQATQELLIGLKEKLCHI